MRGSTSRMTWRDRTLAFAAGICGGLLPGCASRALRDSVAVPPDPKPVAVAPVAPAPATPSSYHLLAGAAPAQAAASTGATEEQEEHPPGARTKQPPPPDAVPAPAIRASEPARSRVTAKLSAAAEPEAKPNKEPPLVEALRDFLQKRPAEAIGRFKECDRLSQEMLLGLLPLTARAGEGDLEKASPEQMAVLLDQVDSLEAPLRTRAPLAIDKICFCRRIEAFGVYDQLPDEPTFQPGDWALVYVELRNFSCERHEAAAGIVSYGTRLVSAAEIRDYRGSKVWPSGAERLLFRRKGPEESRTPWHDYFDNCSLRVPELPPGRYTLWIEIEDVPTKRSVKRSLDFRVSSTVPVRGS